MHFATAASVACEMMSEREGGRTTMCSGDGLARTVGTGDSFVPWSEFYVLAKSCKCVQHLNSSYFTHNFTLGFIQGENGGSNF